MGSLVLEEGTVLASKYRLARPAGFGGMAQLWVATNEATGAEVCIKILVPEGSDGDAVERFRREAHAAARLSHRAIVRIFDLVELGSNGETTSTGRPAALAIVMELLRGETLADYLMTKGKLSLEEAIDVALPFLSALAHAHRAGVVHRDVKPDNIFLAIDPDGHVTPKVLDFGVSKMSRADREMPRPPTLRTATPLTLEGVMLGTPSFMSPEQARGSRNVDARTDVFSAGIVLYMMIAGKNPFESESFHSVVSAILDRAPPRLAAVPLEIWAVIEKALEKDPGARYADATELGIALRRASGRTSTTDSGPHSISTPAPPAGKGLVKPLGGDSHVTVPPVGNAELGDAPTGAAAAEVAPDARRRAVRIVVAVVGASLAVVVAAFLRGPLVAVRSDAGLATAIASPTVGLMGNAAPSSGPATAAPATVAAASAGVAALVSTGATAEPDGGADVGAGTASATAARGGAGGATGPGPGAAGRSAGTPPGAARDGPQAGAVAEKKREGARAGGATKTVATGTSSAAPASGYLREPPIVRDPGF